MILTCDGVVFYTSHTVDEYLGFHQVSSSTNSSCKRRWRHTRNKRASDLSWFGCNLREANWFVFYQAPAAIW